MLITFYNDDGSVRDLSELNIEEIHEMILRKDWSSLQSIPIAVDANGSVTSRWVDNEWKSPLWIRGTERDLSSFITKKTTSLSSDMINELKALVFVHIYLSENAFSISTIGAYLTAYKKLARYLLTIDVTTFGNVNNETIGNYCKKVKQTKVDRPAHKFLREYREYLPFHVCFGSLDDIKVKHNHTQYPVIPDRLYLEWIKKAESIVKKWSKHKLELSKVISANLELYKETELKIINKIRNGYSSVNVLTKFGLKDNQDHEKTKKAKEAAVSAFKADLEKQGIPFFDHGEHDKWLTILKEHGLYVRSNTIYLYQPFSNIECGGVTFKNLPEFKSHLKIIEQHCLFLIFVLSGMRDNELVKIRPEYGAQTITINGHLIHLFHTGKQKIVEGYQAKKDVFVTSELGHDSYHLLSDIYELFRERAINDGALVRKFRVSISFNKPIMITKTNTTRFFRLFSSALTKDDIANLEISEKYSTTKAYKVGEVFNFTPHQARRSLAYYLVALELCGYPQIKQQFSHLSMAMSIYYAKNASKKNILIMYNEVRDERLGQLAQLIIRLKEKAAQSKSLSGKKGEEWNKKHDKVLPIEYYKKEILQNREFISAVAPGMYCTNPKCPKTAQLDIVSDIDCKHEIIEHTSWIAAQRSKSISLLESLHFMDELSSDVASKELMSIRAAEKIMKKHHGDDFIEPYVPSDSISNLLIPQCA